MTAEWTKCYQCNSDMWIPAALNEAALAARGQIAFYCAYGHRQYYIVGQTEEQKLRLERDRLTQRLAQKDDEIKYQREQREATERRLSAARGRITRIRNRVGNGTCPCCNRSFTNLQRHMHTKHPDFSKAEAAE